jgi:hypothetical protein
MDLEWRHPFVGDRNCDLAQHLFSCEVQLQSRSLFKTNSHSLGKQEEACAHVRLPRGSRDSACVLIESKSKPASWTSRYSLEPSLGYSFSIPFKQASSNFRNCEISPVESELRSRCSTLRSEASLDRQNADCLRIIRRFRTSLKSASSCKIRASMQPRSEFERYRRGIGARFSPEYCFGLR